MIRLAPDPDFPPVEFFDETGHYQGIAADYVALIERSLGVRFSILRLQRWDDILEAARHRQVDVLGAVTPTAKRSDYLAFTRPYLELPAHIVTRNDVEGIVGLHQLPGKKVAVVKGYFFQDRVGQDYPGIEVELVADVPTGLTEVSFGGADAMIVNLAVASYYIQNLGLTNLRVSGRTERRYDGRYALGVRSDWPELSRILDKAMLEIGLDQRTAILKKWIALPQAPVLTKTDEATVPERELRTLEALQARIEAIERDNQLDPETRDKALEHFRRALTWQDTARGFDLKAAAFASSLESAQKETERIRRELSARIAAGEPSPPSAPAGVTVAEMEQRLAQAKADLASAQKAKVDLADEIKTQQGRPPKIQDQIAETKLALDRLQWQLAASPAPAANALLVEALDVELEAEKDARTAEIGMLEQELFSYDARLALLVAEYNRSQLDSSRKESVERQLQTGVNALLASEAAAVRQKAESTLRQVVGKHPLLQAAAKENEQLSQRLSALAGQNDALSTQQDKVRDLLKELDRDFRSIEQQLEIAAHSPLLAQVLIAERRKLPNLSSYARAAAERREQVANARLQQFLLNEQRVSLRTQEDDSHALVYEDGVAELSDELLDQLGQLTNERRALLGKLADAYANLSTQLTALGRDEERLADVVRKLTGLLNERLLWTASTTPIGSAWIEQTRRAADWLLGGGNWVRAAQDLIGASLQTPTPTAGTLLLIGILFGMRRQLRRGAAAISERVGNPYRDRFGLTLQLALVDVLWVLPWALIPAGAGWLLRSSLEAEHFSAALGHGLTRLAATVFLVELFWQLSKPRGLAETHFNWSTSACSVLHGNLGWIRFFVYPISFTFGMIELQPAQLVSDAPGRMAFMFGTLGVTLFLWRLMHPRHGALGPYLAHRRLGWVWRLRSIWYPLVIASPLALEALVLSGYYYTATDLATRLGYSFYTILGTLLVYHMMLRWARVAEQRLAISRAVENREASRQARAAQQSGDASGEGVPDTLEVSLASIGEISEQTRSLLRAGALVLVALALWLQWADLAPAGRLLDQVTLWEQTVGVAGEERLEPVTLWAVTKMMAVILLTLIAVQNLPGFLEISILRRLSLDRGSRYAITAVSRYLIIALGVIVASGLIGFGWSKVQWLVAALTVGLGFGLQEIFANFVSGIIVLFERPIRIGDTVTVGTTTGTVTRISTRATTITDWDRKELIIPNKSFVTGDVINWTLSDPITRLIVRIGVAYGSDVERTERLLRELAEAHPMVLDDPPPAVFFSGFGDSSLGFELRVFYRDVLKRTRLTHELNKAINRAFAEHGIEIAFPQRDIHIRSVGPGAWLRLDEGD